MFEKECRARGTKLEGRKAWFGRVGMTNFLAAIPKKVDGGVSVELACEVAEKYLDFESSNAVSRQCYYTR